MIQIKIKSNQILEIFLDKKGIRSSDSSAITSLVLPITRFACQVSSSYQNWRIVAAKIAVKDVIEDVRA